MYDRVLKKFFCGLKISRIATSVRLIFVFPIIIGLITGSLK